MQTEVLPFDVGRLGRGAHAHRPVARRLEQRVGAGVQDDRRDVLVDGVAQPIVQLLDILSHNRGGAVQHAWGGDVLAHHGGGALQREHESKRRDREYLSKHGSDFAFMLDDAFT